MAGALLPHLSAPLQMLREPDCSVLCLDTIAGIEKKSSLFARKALVTKGAFPGGPGGGVLDRPITERTTPGRESEFDLRKVRKMSPPYRVLLHNDNYNKREYVVQVLMKVIPGMTLDNAVNIMQEAHHNGLAVVIICGQVDAEDHCTQLRGNGLLSSIEPASDGC
ncbi:hypothetical protein GOP47_0010765 [Adiantum capillus-veneris]|uniref:Adaptor protein ClpS core domain-containing protein n=1 Tax=Adiantum capillus-veneris TaxID=13818 RepID=A0A9D4UVW1_ADICA|nr:hypothetical protein GOP47_0010765 [Adiantum capillus-veneris]